MRRPELAFAPIALVMIALVMIAMIAGCAAAPTPPPAKPAAPAAPTGPPPCPTALVPGGDPLEGEVFDVMPIGRVCVLGQSEEHRVSAERVISLKPGDAANPDRIRIDLEAIMRLGVFDDASVYGLHGREHVTLIFVVRDRPRIGEIVFDGATQLGNAALAAKFPLTRQSPYDPARVHELAQAVRDEYRARGYESCEVKQVAEPLEGGLVRIRMKVTEGPLFHYAKVIFKGNAKLPDGPLQKVAALKVGKPFAQDEIERAALTLSALYYDHGMVDVRVDVDTGTEHASKDGGLAVTFTIQEGDVFSIGSIRATKLAAPVEKELLTRLKARPKQVFSRATVIQDIERLKSFFESKGQKVEVTPLTEVDPKTKTVNLTFEVEAEK